MEGKERMITEALNIILSYCESIPDCQGCKYYRGCMHEFPDKTLAEVVYNVIKEQKNDF